ncbi:lactose-binding lectin l-2-like [Eleginops maclovinus]|uniref:lactose-binding lectin l-2-like n=1 Tax=Eleginops maclovinus TaxID=56733 RepID=UPI00307FE341
MEATGHLSPSESPSQPTLQINSVSVTSSCCGSFSCWVWLWVLCLLQKTCQWISRKTAVATHLTWADAELYCVSEGANLVSIHSQEQDHFVKTLIKNFDPNEGFTWIGLSDLHKEGSWMWSDGTAANFFFWDAGQPDNLGGEHCGHHNLAHKWNDWICSKTIPSVCALRKT